MFKASVIKTILIVMPLASIFLFVCYYFILVMFYESSVHGINDLPSVYSIKKDIFFAAIAGIAAAAGIVSKVIYDFLLGVYPNIKGTKKVFALGLKSVCISLLLMPVVLGPFLNDLFMTKSVVFSMIICYQNGFFFQTVIGGLDRNAS